MPSMPVGLWGDTDGSLYRDSYFGMYPGIWRQGDWIRFSERGSCVVTGRSDATLNRGGVRLGTGEFYGIVEELPEIADSLVVHLEDEEGGAGELLLFVVLAGGAVLDDELRETISRALRSELSPRHGPDSIDPVPARQTAAELAEYYRERKMMAVVFTVDSESFTGQTRVPNEEIAAVARANADVLIPFASIDPHKGRRGVDEARRLIAEHGVRGFKFHPNVQGFFPNDRMAYPFYEVIQAAGLPALFHTGHSGVGSGLPGGGGVRLKYSNPMHVD